MYFTVLEATGDMRTYDGDCTYTVQENGAFSVYDPDGGEKISYGPSGWYKLVELEEQD